MRGERCEMRDGRWELRDGRDKTCEMRDERQEIRDAKWRAARHGAAREISLRMLELSVPSPAMGSSATRDARYPTVVVGKSETLARGG